MASLNAKVVATLTLTTDRKDFEGPYQRALTFDLNFDAARTAVSVANLSNIVVGPFPTPVGPDTITVSKSSGGDGTFDPTTGALKTEITFLFHHSIAFAGDSTLPLKLTTGKVLGKFGQTGKAVDKVTGAVRLVASSAFVDGYLGDVEAGIDIVGTIAPVPFP